MNIFKQTVRAGVIFFAVSLLFFFAPEQAGAEDQLFDIAVVSLAENNGSGRNTDKAPRLYFGRPLRQKVTGVFKAPAFREPRSGNSLLVFPEDNELVKRYLAQYSSPGGLTWLNAVMKRAEPFIPFIREEIAARELPPELLYLPIIESNYSPTAKSRSGAVGLWQFMKNSISSYDIKVNEWLDERRDFWKSTEAALSKLEENYKYFNDWPLALAAYNAGLGGVSKIIQNADERDYWILCEQKKFKTETIHYVPKLIAVAEILSNPRRYGLETHWPADYKWERIPVGRAASLSLLASTAGVDLEVLRLGNRELETAIIPLDKNYYLKVPGKDAEAIAEVLARKDLELIKYYFHTIRSGDTLLALARHYGVSLDHIMEINPGVKARTLKIGQRIIIPAYKEVAPYTNKRSSAGEETFSERHLVKKGESLWSIALAYNVKPETLAEANGMRLNGVLREGKTLKVPAR